MKTKFKYIYFLSIFATSLTINAKAEIIKQPGIDYELLEDALNKIARIVSKQCQGNSYLFIDCQVSYCDNLHFAYNELEARLFENGVYVVPSEDSPEGAEMEKIIKTIDQDVSHPDKYVVGKFTCNKMISLRIWEVGNFLKMQPYLLNIEKFIKIGQNVETETNSDKITYKVTTKQITEDYNVPINIFNNRFEVEGGVEYISFDFLPDDNTGPGFNGCFWYKLTNKISIGLQTSFLYSFKAESFAYDNMNSKYSYSLSAIKPSIRIGKVEGASPFISLHIARYVLHNEMVGDSASIKMTNTYSDTFKMLGVQFGYQFPLLADKNMRKVLYLTFRGGFDGILAANSAWNSFVGIKYNQKY